MEAGFFVSAELDVQSFVRVVVVDAATHAPYRGRTSRIVAIVLD